MTTPKLLIIMSYFLIVQSIIRRCPPKLSLNLPNLSFLSAKDESTYSATCLRLSTISTLESINAGKNYIEIEFPPSRKSDLSVTETLDANREFTLRRLIARNSEPWKAGISFTITSIAAAVKSYKEKKPKFIVAVNPGFNVEEWIDLENLDDGDIPFVIVNGNIDRLRNGYYPRIFYPKLAKVTETFYSKFTQAYFLSPIAIGGDRFGSWLVRIFPSKWAVVVKAGSGFEVVLSEDVEPKASEAWNAAKNASRKKGLTLF